MRFQHVILLNRLIAPAAFAVMVIGWFLPNPFRDALFWGGGVIFALACGYGALMGLRFGGSGLMRMNCPICDQEGIAGCGVGGGVGWWLRCEDCGIVRPSDWFGFRFSKEPVDD